MQASSNTHACTHAKQRVHPPPNPRTYPETAKGVEIFFVVECHDPDSGELVFKSVATLLYRIKTGIGGL